MVESGPSGRIRTAPSDALLIASGPRGGRLPASSPPPSVGRPGRVRTYVTVSIIGRRRRHPHGQPQRLSCLRLWLPSGWMGQLLPGGNDHCIAGRTRGCDSCGGLTWLRPDIWEDATRDVSCVPVGPIPAPSLCGRSVGVNTRLPTLSRIYAPAQLLLGRGVEE